MTGTSNKESRQLFIKELFNEHYRRLVYFSTQFIGDKAAAEDIVQDSFVKFWNNFDSINLNGTSIKSFLYTSVKNASFNSIRHTKIAQQHIMLQDGNPVEEAVINAMIRSEVLDELYKALESLPYSCQQISRMGYIEGKKNYEIADELGISINTVKTQKQRALKLLRLKLSPEMFIALILLAQR